MSDTKQKGAAKTARAFGKHAIRIVPAETLKKPAWIRVKAGSDASRFNEVKAIDRKSTRLNSSHSDRSRMPSSA